MRIFILLVICLNLAVGIEYMPINYFECDRSPVKLKVPSFFNCNGNKSYEESEVCINYITDELAIHKRYIMMTFYNATVNFERNYILSNFRELHDVSLIETNYQQASYMIDSSKSFHSKEEAINYYVNLLTPDQDYKQKYLKFNFIIKKEIYLLTQQVFKRVLILGKEYELDENNAVNIDGTWYICREVIDNVLKVNSLYKLRVSKRITEYGLHYYNWQVDFSQYVKDTVKFYSFIDENGQRQGLMTLNKALIEDNGDCTTKTPSNVVSNMRQRKGDINDAMIWHLNNAVVRNNNDICLLKNENINQALINYSNNNNIEASLATLFPTYKVKGNITGEEFQGSICELVPAITNCTFLNNQLEIYDISSPHKVYYINPGTLMKDSSPPSRYHDVYYNSTHRLNLGNCTLYLKRHVKADVIDFDPYHKDQFYDKNTEGYLVSQFKSQLDKIELADFAQQFQVQNTESKTISINPLTEILEDLTTVKTYILWTIGGFVFLFFFHMFKAIGIIDGFNTLITEIGTLGSLLTKIPRLQFTNKSNNLH